MWSLVGDEVGGEGHDEKSGWVTCNDGGSYLIHNRTAKDQERCKDWSDAYCNSEANSEHMVNWYISYQIAEAETETPALSRPHMYARLRTASEKPPAELKASEGSEREGQARQLGLLPNELALLVGELVCGL